jgi:hypothetical protein
VHVHQDHVGPEPAGQFDRLHAVDRLADDLDVVLGLEDQPEAAADQGLVVGDQDPGGRHAGYVPSGLVGSRTRTA